MVTPSLDIILFPTLCDINVCLCPSAITLCKYRPCFYLSQRIVLIKSWKEHFFTYMESQPCFNLQNSLFVICNQFTGCFSMHGKLKWIMLKNISKETFAKKTWNGLFRCASISSTYPCQSVRPSVRPSVRR